MDGRIFIPTLENLSLVRICVALWSQNRLAIYTRKEDVGATSKALRTGKKKKLPYKMRKALELVIESIQNFEIPSSLRRKLTDKSERIGYELFLFLNESVLNRSYLKLFTSDNFSQYDTNNVDLANDIRWTCNGEISYSDTLMSYMENHSNASPFLFFVSACENCDEILVFDLWEKFSPRQRNQIEGVLTSENSELSPDTKLFLSYWLCKLNNSTSRINFRIGNRNSLTYNLLIHSLNSPFRSRILYLYSNLTETEKEKFVEDFDVSGKKIISLEQIKTSYKFFEAPVLNHKINQFIIDMLSEDSFEDLIDYCISKLMSFGDLHGNVILYLMSLAPEEIKKWTLNDLNFYLQLLECGQFDVAKELVDEKTKKILREEILTDETLLNHSTNVFINYVQSIYRNGYYDSLVEFFNIISCDNDLMAVLVIGTEKANIKIDNIKC